MREFVIGGLLISPFVKYALIGAVLFVPIRLILVLLDFHKWFWHPLLAEASVYLCLVAALNILM